MWRSLPVTMKQTKRRVLSSCLVQSVKSQDFQWCTRRYIPEDRTVHNLRSENVKSYMTQHNVFCVIPERMKLQSLPF
jgi:hypothetical protein